MICKCGHSESDHLGTAMICFKQTGPKPNDLCTCLRFVKY